MPKIYIFSFSEGAILENVSDHSGVYALYNSEKQLIYYGKAQKQTLKERMLQHLSSNNDCLSNACYFSIETTKNADKRLSQLLRHYMSKHGRQPECNERLESVASKTIEKLRATGVLTTAFIR